MNLQEYILKPIGRFDTKAAIPDHKCYVDPVTYRRGVWKPSKVHHLERSFCPNFVNKKSFNTNARLSYEEVIHAEKILTLYKWFTRNECTNMKNPIDKKLLYDRKFINIAEAFLKKKKLFVPEFASAA